MAAIASANFLWQISGKLAQSTDGLQPYSRFVHLPQLVLQKALQQSHQALNLGCGALPVLRRKCVERQIFHSALDRGVDAFANGFCALFVAYQPRESAALRPAAVSVHDDRDVAGDSFHGTRERLETNRLLPIGPDTYQGELRAGQ